MYNDTKVYYENVKTISSIIASNGTNQVSYELLEVLGIDVEEDKRYRDFFALHGYELVNDYNKITMNDLEERELIILAQEGNQKALNRLLRSYEKFIVYTTLCYTGVNDIRNIEDVEDCKQEARLAFIKAVKTYDVNRLSRLFKHANPMIINALQEWKSDKNMIRIPARTWRDSFAKFCEANKKFEQTNRRSATDEELVEITGLTLNQVKNVRSKLPLVSTIIATPEVLANMIDDDREEGGANELEDKFNKIVIQELLNEVFPDDERSKEIFWMYYGLGLSKQQIMNSLKYFNKKRVNDIIDDGLEQMRLLIS